MVLLDRYDGLDLDSYHRIVRDGEPLEIAPELLAEVARGREALLRHLATGAVAYGVTTGLGYLASVPVGESDQASLQRSLLTARASGLGPPLPADVVRGAMLLRLTGFLSGFPGVTVDACRFVVERLNGGWSPLVPWGPYGAAGEVAPLAHLFQTFLGEGSVRVGDETLLASEALDRAGVPPYDPGPKEGVALINGSPFATALAVYLGDRGARLLDQSILAAALVLELTGATVRQYAERVAALSGDEAEQRVGERLRELLDGGAEWGDRPQPPVSFRVVSQVYGALRRALEDLESTAAHRLRGVSDSPLFLEGAAAEPAGLYPSGGFHALDVTLRLEAVAAAVAHATNLVEKQLHRLLDSRFSGLPEQLAREPGRQAGAVALHKAVVALTAANRLLAAPASVHALDTSSGQEDVQSFTFLAAHRLEEALDNHEAALAYALVALRQAAHQRGTATAPRLVDAIERLGSVVAPIDEDRTLSPDVERVVGLLRGGAL